MGAARRVGIGEERLPDFLGLELATLSAIVEADRVSSSDLREAVEDEIQLWSDTHPDDDVAETERAIVGTARVGQQQFARKVLMNFGFACVFCGLSFKSLGLPSARMLVASHIKPWRHSLGAERIDPHNGLAACPTHDAAFDALLITVLPDLSIVTSGQLSAAIAQDAAVARNFGPAGMFRSLALSPTSHPPTQPYLEWHRDATLGRVEHTGSS